MKLNLTVEISDLFLQQILSNCIEGGSTYWAHFPVVQESLNGGYIGAKVEEWGDEPKRVSKKEITALQLRIGVSRILNDTFTSKASHAGCHSDYRAELFGAVVALPGGDAGKVAGELSDLVLQATYFGCIIYG